MQAATLVELIRSGNHSAVERQWSAVLESADVAPERLAGYEVVLQELVGAGKGALAEELAWTALEITSSRSPPAEVLKAAGPFLLAVGESETLRTEVANLYRAAYDGLESLEELLAESGIAGGRPVRRALRTLEVCLGVCEGGYLASREDDRAARIDCIERPGWRFRLSGGFGEESLGAVALADRYRPASPDEFRVMREFARDALTKQLWDAPTDIVIQLCQERATGIADEELRALVVPDLIAQEQWKKWWGEARSALKRCPHIKVEGRSPCTLIYVHAPVSAHGEFLDEFEAKHEPLARLSVMDKYLRDCKARGESPDAGALGACYERLRGKAVQRSAGHSTDAGIWWVAARRAADLAAVRGEWEPAIHWLRSATNLVPLLRVLNDETLFRIACDWLAEALGDRWHVELLRLLPSLPTGVCDLAARRLVECGKGRSDFEAAIQAILANPVESFEALMWLWDGPTTAQHLPVPPLPVLLSRVIRTLDDCRRNEAVPRETAKTITACARSILSARRFERFRQCLEQLEAGVANTLVRQIRQLDGLGRAVPEDMVSLIRRRFPPVKDLKVESYPWDREDVILVTAAGLARKQEEIHHHVNVKMKENAIAIGRAAELGDLSENSEYKFALEERDLLRARLAQMNAEVAAARVLSAADVPTGYVGVGTKAIFERVADGERYEMTVLGPWEADPVGRLFNYKAPMCQKVLGKRIGDTVEFNHSGAVGTFRLVALENALVAKES